MSDNEQWLRDELAGAVPPAPPSGDRLAGIAERRRRHQRRVAAGAAIATCVTVVAATLAGRAVLGDDSASEPATTGPTEQTSPSEAAPPELDCPKDLYSTGGGPGTLESGAVAARLCSGGGPDSVAPADTLAIGLDSLVDTINGSESANLGCLGGIGGDYALVVAYPDGSVRRVLLRLACDYLHVGSRVRTAGDTFQRFSQLLREQRANTNPPATTPEPKCARDQIYSAFAKPDDMVAARMCVSYAEGASWTTSVEVTTDDLEAILDGWRAGTGTPSVKGPGCSPTTPHWILSGVTAWGDEVTIEAECDRPTRGQVWVTLPPAARDVVDRLIEQAGVQVSDGSDAEHAWWLADAWIDAVNARAIVSYDKTAAEIGRIANEMWVGEPWLPNGELDWDLLEASEIDVPGWQFAWRVPARTPTGEAVFTIVRDNKDDPWRIVSLIR